MNDVLGFWKHDTMLPGSRLETHNHCWNAIKLNGRWRLLDLFWAVRSVREGVATPFYVSPEVSDFPYCSPIHVFSRAISVSAWGSHLIPTWMLINSKPYH